MTDDYHEIEYYSAVEPDWGRERKPFFAWNPPISLMLSIRAYQAARGWSAPVQRRVATYRHRFWSIVTGADIPVNAKIGGGLRIPHPNGVVILPLCSIGPNCMVFQQVTIGATEKGYPTIGGHVDIGAGAKVIGPVTIGDHAKIGANAVVVSDVPPYATAVGIPARVVAIRNSENDPFY